MSMMIWIDGEYRLATEAEERAIVEQTIRDAEEWERIEREMVTPEDYERELNRLGVET